MNPTVIAAIVSALVAFVIGILSFALTFWRTHRELQGAERKLREELEVELIRQRIQCYEDLMRGLRALSTRAFVESAEAARRSSASDAVESIQAAIFGKFGLVASHETRETVLRLRAKCRQFLDGSIDFEQVRKASWEAHQMLRSDLGLAQPNVLTAIDRLRRADLSGTEPQIEELLSKIHHNRWGAWESGRDASR